MSLRLGLGLHLGAGARTPPVVAAWTPADLSPEIWQQKSTGLTGSTPVTAWANQGSSGSNFASGAGPDVGASGLDFAAGEYLAFAGAKSLTNFLHLASSSCVIWYTQGSDAGSHILVDSNGGSSTNLGYSALIDQTNQRLTLRIGNGSGTAVSYNTANGSVTNSTAHRLEIYIDSAGGSSATQVICDGVSILSNALTGSFGVGDSAYALTLAGRGSAPTTLSLVGTFTEIIALDRILTAGEIASVRAYTP